MVLGSDITASMGPLLILLGVAVGTFVLSVPLAHRRARRAPKPENLSLHLPVRSFGGAFVGTFAGIFKHRPLSSTILLAVVAYAFYYPMAYVGQTPVKLPVAVIDQDHSAFSRRLVREMNATRALDASVVAASPAEAERMLRNGEVDAVMHIPERFETSLIHGDAKGIGLYLNGAYLVRTTAMGKALGGAAEQVLTPVIEATRLLERAPTVTQRPLYNTTDGYGSYAVPAVSAIILQQTLLLGAALFAGLRRETGAQALSTRSFLGLWAAPPPSRL